MIRTLLAPNPSAMTLDGTRTYIIGVRRLAIIDPGPATGVHLRAIADAVERPSPGDPAAARRDDVQSVGQRVEPESVVILLTHTHPDHAEGASWLGDRLHARVRAVAHRSLREGDTVATDGGDLTTLRTPGHTPDHAAFWMPDTATVFCGDLMMGGLDTALVSPPDGNLRQYLESLDRLRRLEPTTIMPAHGPPFDDARGAIDRYVEHRMLRCQQVLDSLGSGEWFATRDVATRVYGREVPRELREVAWGAVVAYLDYLTEDGRVERNHDRWRLTGS